MTTQILSILSPIRILKVQDWMKVATKILREKTGGYLQPTTHRLQVLELIVKLQSRFEELVSKPLTKEMIVCGVEEPKCYEACQKSIDSNKTDYDILEHEWDGYREYEAAQGLIWFDGIFHSNHLIIHLGNQFYFRIDDGALIHNSNVLAYSPTVYDLIYHISKYNETSTSKIELEWSESFVEELLK